MSSTNHEPYVHEEEIPLPSERSTGLVFAVVAAIIAAFWFNSPYVFWPAAVISLIFLTLSLLSPAVLAPVNRAWFKFGMLLNKVVSPVVMFVLFSFVMVPAGLVMRLFRDPLQNKRNPDTQTYWRKRDKELDNNSSMQNQF